MLVSGVAHVVLVAALSFAPKPEAMLLSQAMTVDLVAAVPAPPSSAPKAVPAKPAAPKPTPAPPPPPPPKPAVKILPKEAPTPIVQAKPKPEPKPVAKPKPEPFVARPERPKELSYEDTMAKLRDDVGEETPVAPAPQTVANAQVGPAATASSRSGVLVSPEVAAWNLAVMRHIRSNWITPPEFRRAELAAQLQMDVAEDGSVVGVPKVIRSSGNPSYDDNAVRAVMRASPLPPAPKAGRRTLIFTSEE